MHIHLGLQGIAPTALWLAEIVCFLISVSGRPTVGLYLLIPLLPLQTVRYWLHGYIGGAQFIDVLLLGIVIGLKRQGQLIFPKTPLNTLLWVYIVYTYLSLFRGAVFLGVDLPIWFTDPRMSEWKNCVFDMSLLFFVIVSAIRTKRQMGVLLACMFVGALVLAKGFHDTISGRDFSSFSYDLRDSGAIGWAGVNGLAAFEAQLGLFTAALCLIEPRLWKKAAYLGVIGAAIYCLVFSLSRGGYAAFLIGILYLGFVRSRLLLAGLLVFLLVWPAVVPPAVKERVLMTTDSEGGMDHSAASRLSLWEEAAGVFKADPVFGTGYYTYAFGSHVGGYGDTHNLFVKILVETGLAGLFIFLALFRKLFQIGFRLYRTADDPFLKSIGLGFSALMIGVFVGNLFGDRWMYFQITGYTYAFAALAFRAQQLTDEEHGQGEEQEEPVEGQTTDVVLENGESSVSGTEPIQNWPYQWEPREGYAPGSNLS